MRGGLFPVKCNLQPLVRQTLRQHWAIEPATTQQPLTVRASKVRYGADTARSSDRSDPPTPPQASSQHWSYVPATALRARVRGAPPWVHDCAQEMMTAWSKRGHNASSSSDNILKRHMPYRLHKRPFSPCPKSALPKGQDFLTVLLDHHCVLLS